MMKKIVFLKDLNETDAQFSNKSIVLVGGCFDLLHYGHLTFLRNAKKEGDFLIVALESDEFIKSRKKRLSIHNQQQRAEILASLEIVDLVVKLPLFKSDKEYFDLNQLIKPKVIAITAGDPQIKNKERQAKEIGSTVKIVVDLIENFSSQKIIKVFD